MLWFYQQRSINAGDSTTTHHDDQRLSGKRDTRGWDLQSCPKVLGTTAFIHPDVTSHHTSHHRTTTVSARSSFVPDLCALFLFSSADRQFLLYAASISSLLNTFFLFLLPATRDSSLFLFLRDFPFPLWGL